MDPRAWGANTIAGDTRWILPATRVQAFFRFLLAAIFFVAANFLAAILASLFVHSEGPLFQFASRTFLLLLLLAGYSLMLRVFDDAESPLLPRMGLGVQPGWNHQWWAGFWIAGLLIIFAVIALGVFGDVRFKLLISTGEWRQIILMTGLIAVAALAEEVAFRGYPFQRLVQSIGPVGGAIALSALFGIGHAMNPAATIYSTINTALVGIVFSVAFLRTGRLWLPWGFHFGWNYVLGVIAGLPVSGLWDFNIFGRTEAIGPKWLTGGEYGIEGSATGTVVILIGFGLVLTATRKVPRHHDASSSADAAASAHGPIPNT